MKSLSTLLFLGTISCASNSNLARIEELRQTTSPTVLIENWRWEPIGFNILYGTQFDSLGVVLPKGGKRCFEMPRQESIISFAYENIIYQTPVLRPEYWPGWHLVIGKNPAEDVMSIEPSIRCNPDGSYLVF